MVAQLVGEAVSSMKGSERQVLEIIKEPITTVAWDEDLDFVSPKDPSAVGEFKITVGLIGLALAGALGIRALQLAERYVESGGGLPSGTGLPLLGGGTNSLLDNILRGLRL